MHLSFGHKLKKNYRDAQYIIYPCFSLWLSSGPGWLRCLRTWPASALTTKPWAASRDNLTYQTASTRAVQCCGFGFFAAFYLPFLKLIGPGRK